MIGKALLPLCLCMLFLGGAAGGDDCTLEKIYSAPLSAVGTRVACRGKIVSVQSVSMPLGLLLETKKRLWYAECYDSNKAAGMDIREGRTFFVKGTCLGTKRLLHRGSGIEIPKIMVSEISR